MIVIPSQTSVSLPSGTDLFHQVDFDMIGIVPYSPHPEPDSGMDENLIDPIGKAEIID